LVRHGATEWNASGRYQGQSDVELSELGRRQARAIADRLRSDLFDRIYASDLQRARETAETIALPRRLQVTTDARLREFHFGDWEGLTWPEITALHPDLNSRSDIVAAYAPPGGETLADVIARWSSFQRDVLSERSGRVLVVTHAGMLHAAMRAMAPHGSEAVTAGRFRFAPTSLTRVVFDADGSGRVTSLSDASHLDSDSSHWHEASRQATRL
jgi:alpha-ribazole phosphatase